ncbi:MAG: hypothetical protein EON58_14605 [Alphaproteobacteria bacterium]|nr:MAG: hypothetical protein EON58_14605 [Alphaproteobacteria bacterium]
MRATEIAMLMLSAAGLAACNQSDGKPDSQPSPTLPVESEAAQTSTSMWNKGAIKRLDLQVAHPNGVVLQVTSLQSRATDTAVGIRIINGRDDEIDLNRFPNNRNGFILLESGERLYLSPTATNPTLTVPAKQTFEGELVFLGRMPPVKSAIMVLNEQSSGNATYSTSPGFRVDLPLQNSPL